MNKMIGAFGPYCIFKTREGIFVRHETLSDDPKRPGKIKRAYRTLNTVPVATRGEADQIIEQAMLGPVAEALAHAGRTVSAAIVAATPAFCEQFRIEIERSAPGIVAAANLMRGRLQ